MLKRLRRQFVATAVALVGIVLVISLGSTLWSMWSNQEDMTRDQLERTLEQGLDHGPRFGGLTTILIETTTDGVVLARSDSSSSLMDVDVLTDVVDQVLSAEASRGVLDDYHVTWMREATTNGWRIALADTSQRDASFASQAAADLVIFAVAMAAVFLVAEFLSSMALKPVTEAWEKQQRFVSDASHELKTPLSVIIANTQILEKDKSLPSDARRWVDSTADEAAHMKELVEDLLALARTDEAVSGSATSALVREDVDLSRLVDECALEFDALAFERGCTLETHIEPGLSILGDRSQLSRAIRTLLDNASKYAAKGTAVEVDLVRAARGRARLTVNNQGTPIPAEELDHLFDRFYRSDKSRSRDGVGGFGLGLAIAKGIFDAHGAKISVTSDEASGTTFAVDF